MIKRLAQSGLFAVLAIGILAAYGQVYHPPMTGPNGDVSDHLTFTVDGAAGQPTHYSLAVSAMGNATYHSVSNSVENTGEPYMREFEISSATRAKIFSLVQQLHDLQGDLGLMQPGPGRSYSLNFSNDSGNNEIFYSSSSNPTLNELTSLLESICATVESGHTIQSLEGHNQAALQVQLRNMEQQARQGKLVEFSAIAPIVQQVAINAKIPWTTRQYAETILKEMESVH